MVIGVMDITLSSARSETLRVKQEKQGFFAGTP